MDVQPGGARMRRWAWPVIASGLVAALALGLAGCGAPAPAVTPSATADATVAPSQPGATPTPSPSQAPAAPVGPPAPAPSASMVPAPGASAAPPAGGAPLTAPSLPTTEAALGEEVDFDTGFTVEVVSLRAIEVTAETPGEVSGPALVVEVAARNGSAAARSVDSAVVTVQTEDGEVGIGTTAGSPSPLTGVVAPGETASGRYVFMLDPASGRDVTITINYAAGEPVAVFTGTTP